MYIPLHACAYHCMPVHATACLYIPLRAHTYHCMPVHATACLYIPLCAHTCHCMPIHTTACLFTPLHAYPYLKPWDPNINDTIFRIPIKMIHRSAPPLLHASMDTYMHMFADTHPPTHIAGGEANRHSQARRNYRLLDAKPHPGPINTKS